MAIRVLLVTGSYPPDHCGVGDYAQCLAAALGACPDIDVWVLTTGTGTRIGELGHARVLRAMADWSLRRLGAFSAQLRRIRPDIVHIQYPTQGYGDGKLPWLMPILARAAGAQVVQTWHEGYPHDLTKFRLLAAAPGRVVIVREHFLQQFGQAFARIAGRRRLTYINSAATLPLVESTEALNRALRERYGIGDRRLLVFFGFVNPAKQVEQLFAIGNPETDHILIVGETSGQASYLAELDALVRSPEWRGRAQIVGFVDAIEVASIIAASDALVLPLRDGAGPWNTAVLAGMEQGAFVLATATAARGYEEANNVYYAPVGDQKALRLGLNAHAGIKRRPSAGGDHGWRSIAQHHVALYEELLSSRSARA